MKKWFSEIWRKYQWGSRLLSDSYHLETISATEKEIEKKPHRSEVINYHTSLFGKNCAYLEIGVRDPSDNFDRINANIKTSVDPGVEYLENPVEHQMSSDEFFNTRKPDSARYDVIFIDGLHLADQVSRDIANGLNILNPNGYLIIHDCNPPTEYHAREEYGYDISPARRYWNGTTWKAYFRCRLDPKLSCCCIDTDWGLGIIQKSSIFPFLEENINPFYEFSVLMENRTLSLNLMSFEKYKAVITSS